MNEQMRDIADMENVSVRPSPQRVRNILTLEERVAAIQAYAARPMYTKVAKMFNCSWEQIKNIIANRQAILEFHEATKNAERQSEPQVDWARKRKIDFLGECVYEYMQRLQFHNKVDLSEELIRCKALEFRDVIRIDGFVPNKAWINHFKAAFNFSLSNRQLRLTRAPPTSLDLRDVMMFVTKIKSKQTNTTLHRNQQQQPPQHQQSSQQQPTYRPSTMLDISYENDAVLNEVRQRQQRKLNFLERALLEYATRSKFHLKVTLDDKRLCETANSLCQILKMQHFQADAMWLKSFKSRFNFDSSLQFNLSLSTRTPPLSLDLRDILSYCSRLEKNSQIGAADQLRNNNNNNVNGSRQSQMVDKLFHVTKRTRPNTNGVMRHTDAQKPLPAVKDEIIDLADEDDQQQQHQGQTLKRLGDPLDEIMETQQQAQPALKIRKIESMCRAANELTPYFMQHSPGHWSEPSEKDDQDDGADVLPKTVSSYKDALKLLKPLEEFAMLEENYRAIGLIEQLESIFKNPPKKHDEEEEFNN